MGRWLAASYIQTSLRSLRPAEWDTELLQKIDADNYYITMLFYARFMTKNICTRSSSIVVLSVKSRGHILWRVLSSFLDPPTKKEKIELAYYGCGSKEKM